MHSLFTLIRKRGLACTCRKIKRRLFIRDETLLSHIARLGAYDYVQKYRYALNQPPAGAATARPPEGRIWVCWLQGLAQAPHLVQHCVQSIAAHHGRDVVLLDAANIPQYIEVPDCITRKWRAGTITHTHYSDIVRIFLLAKHGGLWIDATTFLLDSIPDYIRHAPLFAYKCAPLAQVVAASWLMAAQPNHPVIRNVKNLLCAYWQHENKLATYSLIHLFFTMATRSSDATGALWRAVPHFDDANCKLLQQELFEPFSATRLAQIKQLSPVQKLSYKFPAAQAAQTGTFYSALFTQIPHV
jgi:hypothetical protein